MAKKKSALSKGYRKNVKKESKTILTKKEIFILLAIVAVIALAIILFDLFYNDGYLTASDVQENDVVSWVSKDAKNRFVKLAEAKDVEGFEKHVSETNGNIKSIEYTPVDEGNPVEKFYITGSFVDASVLTEATFAYLGGASGDNFTSAEELEVQGHKAYVFSYTYDYYDDPAGEAAAAANSAAEEHESDTFCQGITCYIEYPDSYSLALHINLKGADESIYVADDAIADYALGFTDAFSIVEPEAEAE